MGNKERVNAGIRYGLLYTVAIMLAGFIGIEILAVPLSGMFDLAGETNKLCISAMRIISVSYVFAGANIAFQGIFQALEKGFESLVISVCRQFLFIIPVAIVFAKLITAGILATEYIWISFIVAEVLSVLVSVAFMKKIQLIP